MVNLLNQAPVLRQFQVSYGRPYPILSQTKVLLAKARLDVPIVLALLYPVVFRRRSLTRDGVSAITTGHDNMILALTDPYPPRLCQRSTLDARVNTTKLDPHS